MATVCGRLSRLRMRHCGDVSSVLKAKYTTKKRTGSSHRGLSYTNKRLRTGTEIRLTAGVARLVHTLGHSPRSGPGGWNWAYCCQAPYTIDNLVAIGPVPALSKVRYRSIEPRLRLP
jgi:hypothetical protein